MAIKKNQHPEIVLDKLHIYKVSMGTKAAVTEWQLRDQKDRILAVSAKYGQHAYAPLGDEMMRTACIIEALRDVAVASRALQKMEEMDVHPADTRWKEFKRDLEKGLDRLAKQGVV